MIYKCEAFNIASHFFKSEIDKNLFKIKCLFVNFQETVRGVDDVL